MSLGARGRGDRSEHSDRSESDDAELVARVVAGNLAALGILYDRYHDDVRRFVLRATLRADEADDIVHDVFLTVQRAGSIYDGRGSARPFLLGIASQVARERSRKRARFLRMLSTFRECVMRVVSHTPEDAVSDTFDMECLERAIARLPQDKQVVLLMVEREGLSGDEVAAALGIPVATVWTRLHYARTALRRALAKRRMP